MMPTQDKNSIHDQTLDSECPLLVVPAAGLGVRLGSPQAKEMWINPRTQKRFIESAFDICKNLGLHLHLISRVEKNELNAFCQQRAEELKISLSIQFLTRDFVEKNEWMESVLESQQYWRNKNLLFLPDTSFEPWSITQPLLEDIEDVDASFATFTPLRPQPWGCLRVRPQNHLELFEKPTDASFAMAWGLIAFTQYGGFAVFRAMSFSFQQRQPQILSLKFRIRRLDFFEDLTRDRSNFIESKNEQKLEQIEKTQRVPQQNGFIS